MSQSVFALALAWRAPVFGLAFGLACALYVSKISLVLSLQRRHNVMWQQLASPTPKEIVFNPRGSTAKGLWSWVWRRDYIRLRDFRVSLPAMCYRTAMIAFFPVALVAISIVSATGL